MLAVPSSLVAQTPFDTVQIRTIPVAAGVSMLQGSGGNIGVSAGADGVFIVDDQFAPLVPKIRAAVAALSPKPIRFVINTHLHGDHTGGNAPLAQSGSVIIAHDNVRTRMSVEQFNERTQRRTPAAASDALPVVTFSRSVSLHLNGDDVDAIHVPRAHTDGDAIIRFRTANVIHMGDTYFNGSYPYIDDGSGGTIGGVIGAADSALALANDDTKIIPGHGALSNKRELRAYRDLLATIRDRVQKLKAEGKTMEQVVAAKPTAEWDAKWGTGFMKPDTFLAIVYLTVDARR